MDAGLLDMLHHATDDDLLAIGQGIDIHLAGIVQETVKQHRRVVRHFDGFAHVAFEIARLMHDFHGAATEHVGWTDDEWVTDFFGQTKCVGFRSGRAVGGLLETEVVQQFLEPLTVFGRIDHVRRSADDRHAVGLEIARELERCLSTELHDHADRFFDGDDFQYILQRQRFEVQPIRGIVVGRHSLRIAIDHDRFITVFAHRQGGMHTAVVELNALADAVRPSTENHDFLAVTRISLALLLVSRIHVRSARRELSRAGVNPLIDRTDAQQVTTRPHLGLGRFHQPGQATIREPFALQRAQRRRVEIVELHVVKLHLDLDDILDLRKEPWIDMRQLMHFIKGKPVLEGVPDIPDAFRARFAEFLLQLLAVGGALVHSVDADFQAA